MNQEDIQHNEMAPELVQGDTSNTETCSQEDMILK